MLNRWISIDTTNILNLFLDNINGNDFDIKHIFNGYRIQHKKLASLTINITDDSFSMFCNKNAKIAQVFGSLFTGGYSWYLIYTKDHDEAEHMIRTFCLVYRSIYGN